MLRKRKKASAQPPAFRYGDPLYPDYTMRFGKQAQAYEHDLWPESGPADSVQGELFRAVEKLWFEGQDNGNINWGADWEIFLDLLSKHLLAPGVLDETDRQMAERSLGVLQYCGRTAFRNKPEWSITEDYERTLRLYPQILEEPEVDSVDFGYVHDDLYKHLIDCCVIFADKHPDLISYEPPAGFFH